MHLLRRLVATLSAVTALLLSGCTSPVDGVVTSGESSAQGEDRVVDALALVPATAGSAEVVDLTVSKQRWGLSGVTSQTDPSSAEARQLRSKLMATGLGTTLLIYSAQLEDSGWNGLDVDQEIRPEVDGPPVTIYRLRSTLDMQTVTSSLGADGMKRSGGDDAPFFEPASVGAGTFGRMFLSGVTVYPALHLLVAGPQGSWTMPPTGTSLAGVDGVTALMADLPPADYVAIDTGGSACVDPAASGRSTPESARKYLAALDAAGERRPVTGTLVAVTGDDAGQIRAGYADAADAAADLPVRVKILQTVASAVSKRPYAELFTASITAAGPTLRYAVSMTRPSILSGARQQRDAPWAFC